MIKFILQLWVVTFLCIAFTVIVMALGGKDFQYMVTAFNNPQVKLIARSSEHALAIKNYCNRDVSGVVEDFNIQQLYEVINNVSN